MERNIFWVVIALISIFFVYYFAEVIAPFLIAFLCAFFLQPSIKGLSKYLFFSRELATNVVFVAFVGILIVILTYLIPLIYNQITLLISKIPEYRDILQVQLIKISDNLEFTDPEFSNKVGDSVNSVFDGLFSVMTSFANHIWEYTMATVNLLIILIIVPFLLYYFLRDWSPIIAASRSLLPAKEKEKIEKFVIDVHHLLAAYIRGQLNICIILSLYYIATLSLLGYEFAFLFGIFSGFVIIVPMVGTLISCSIVLISSYFAAGWTVQLVYITFVYTVGYIIEGYILAPKVIGKSIGLHPLWVMFAVFAGANIYGLLGIFLALPIAGIIKLLFIHVLKYYRSTKIYNDNY